MVIVYPETNYNSFLSGDEASNYFYSRIGGDTINYDSKKYEALITAFRSLQELDITIDLTDSAQLQAIKDAQCEQALHEFRLNKTSNFVSVDLPDMKIKRKELPRYSERALSILRPYLKAPSITLSR